MKCTLLAAAMMVAASTFTCMPEAQAQTLPDLTVAAEKATPSVVYIKVTTNSKRQTVEYFDPFEDFFGDFFGRGNGNSQKRQREIETPKRTGAGSGVILSQNGYIVTNNHVVADADELLVKLEDNREFKARIIGTDATTDLALIKVEATGLPAISVAKSDEVRVGEWCLAIGNPYGLTSTVTAGIVSAKARSVGASRASGETTSTIESFIQTDAAINPGNSGGALVNQRGQLIGINAMIYSQTGSYTGYGFAIPTSIMERVVSDIKQYGSVQRAVLGISGIDVSQWLDAQQAKGKEPDLGTVAGIYVGDVALESAADQAGLKEGDVILSIDGKAVNKMGELQEIMTSHRPGDKVEVRYMRDKKERKASVTLLNVQGGTENVSELDDKYLGAALRSLTLEEKQTFSLRYGLMVSAVRDGKLQQAGVTKGIILLNVNDREMREPSDFETVVREANLTTDRVLWIRAKTQSGRPLSFTVELGDDDAQKAPAAGSKKK